MTRIFPPVAQADHDNGPTTDADSFDQLHAPASLSRQSVHLEPHPGGWLITVSSPVETGKLQLLLPQNRAESAKIVCDTRNESTFLPFDDLYRGGYYAEAASVAEHELESARHSGRKGSVDCGNQATPADTNQLLVKKLHQVAKASQRKGEYERAEAAATEAIAICETAPHEFGLDLIRLEHLRLCIRYFHRASDDASTLDSRREMDQLRKRSEELLGACHPETARIMTSQARLLVSEFSYYEAEDLLKEAIRIQTQTLGDESLEVSESLLELAKLNAFQEKHDEAETEYRKSLAIREKICGPDHPDVADVLFHYTDFLIYNRGDTARAGSFLRRAMSIWSQTIGLDHSLVVKESGFIQKVLAVNADT